MAPSTPQQLADTHHDEDEEPCSSYVAIYERISGGTSMMKEEDAAILERGVGDSCSSGRTPVLSPLSPPSTDDLPMITPSANSSVEIIEEPLACSKSEECEECKTDSFSHRISINPSLNQISENDSNSDGAITIDGKGYRRCLSGEVRCVTYGESKRCNEDSHREKDFGSDMVSTTACPGSESNDKENVCERRFSMRSKSFDRRLNEAVQFAEAVGELPPTNQSEVQVIIEESGSEYDDDSDEEVHVNKPRITHAADKPSAGSRTDENRLSDTSAITAKSRPRWPFQQSVATSSPFMHKLPAETEPPQFVYKGISSNPPEITRRGLSRGNYAQLHRKAWLEVSDKYHRYGKNLRLYYRYWERLGFPTNQFFDWLDSKGEAAGEPLPNLDECPRSQLDADTVLYITNPEITQGYALDIVADENGRGLVVDVDGDPVKTGPDGWIFVLRDKKMYGAQKITSVTGHSKQRFHHSSFFGGKAVAAAGIILTDDEGYMTRFYPHSGHYRPGEADVQRMLFYLHHKGVDMRTLEVDTQQFLHVTRFEHPRKAGQVSDECAEKKKKKTESLHLQSAVYVASLLAHKARCIEEGVFEQLHAIRKADVATVREALAVVDDEGFWRKICREYRGPACCAENNNC